MEKILESLIVEVDAHFEASGETMEQGLADALAAAKEVLGIG